MICPRNIISGAVDAQLLIYTPYVHFEAGSMSCYECFNGALSDVIGRAVAGDPYQAVAFAMHIPITGECVWAMLLFRNKRCSHVCAYNHKVANEWCKRSLNGEPPEDTDDGDDELRLHTVARELTSINRVILERMTVQRP